MSLAAPAIPTPPAVPPPPLSAVNTSGSLPLSAPSSAPASAPYIVSSTRAAVSTLLPPSYVSAPAPLTLKDRMWDQIKAAQIKVTRSKVWDKLKWASGGERDAERVETLNSATVTKLESLLPEEVISARNPAVLAIQKLMGEITAKDPKLLDTIFTEVRTAGANKSPILMTAEQEKDIADLQARYPGKSPQELVLQIGQDEIALDAEISKLQNQISQHDKTVSVLMPKRDPDPSESAMLLKAQGDLQTAQENLIKQNTAKTKLTKTKEILGRQQEQINSKRSYKSAREVLTLMVYYKNKAEKKKTEFDNIGAEADQRIMQEEQHIPVERAVYSLLLKPRLSATLMGLAKKDQYFTQICESPEAKFAELAEAKNGSEVIKWVNSLMKPPSAEKTAEHMKKTVPRIMAYLEVAMWEGKSSTVLNRGDALTLLHSLREATRSYAKTEASNSKGTPQEKMLVFIESMNTHQDDIHAMQTEIISKQKNWAVGLKAGSALTYGGILGATIATGGIALPIAAVLAAGGTAGYLARKVLPSKNPRSEKSLSLSKKTAIAGGTTLATTAIAPFAISTVGLGTIGVTALSALAIGAGASVFVAPWLAKKAWNKVMGNKKPAKSSPQVAPSAVPATA